MISEKDIEKIETRFRKIFVTKDEFYLLVQKVELINSDVAHIKDNMIVIITMLDSIAKGFAELRMEFGSLTVSDDRQNTHIKQLAEKPNTILTE